MQRALRLRAAGWFGGGPGKRRGLRGHALGHSRGIHCGSVAVDWIEHLAESSVRCNEACFGSGFVDGCNEAQPRVRADPPKGLAHLSWTPDGVRCKHSDRLILEETQHGPIHGRLPLRQRPNCGVGTPIPGRPLSLSRLPQASWGPFSRFRGVPSGCGDDRWRNTRLRRAVFLSPLRLVHFRTHRRRNRSEPRIPGCP